MDAAALLFLISGIAVAFGWQPMPDGSQRYEYVVQVEPEVAKTLAEGQSIPIVGDIPDEVQPVGRIRLVVGREAPPRQRLVTHLKPATGGGGEAGGVELAQYGRYGDSRYTAAPPVQQPPTGAPQSAATSSHPYGQAAAPASAQQGGETSWNNDEPPITPTGSAPPSGAQLFGQQAAEAAGGENTWNGSQALEAAATAVGNSADNSIKQIGQELQNAAQPGIQKGIQRFDSEVRSAADAFGDRTRKLMNELQQPLEQPQLPADHQPLAARDTPGGEQAWNQGQDARATTNPLRNGSHEGGSTWNGQPAASNQSPQAPSPNITPANTANAGTSPGRASIDWNGSQHGSASTPAPQPARGVDPWAGVPDPRSQTGAGTGAADSQPGVPELATRPLPFGGLGGNPVATGPQFTSVDNSGQQSQGLVAHAPGSEGNATSPVVRSDMLQRPADRPLDGEVTQPVATTPASTTAATSAPANTWGTSPQTSQPAPTTPTATVPAAADATGTAVAPNSGGNAVAVLVAWVLLSGSVAGNLYLFWSYLDVRQKYRALVRKTARAVGSRFSAA